MDFTRTNFKKTLFEWYGVPYTEPKTISAEPSRHPRRIGKLRRELHLPGSKVLLHMPFGAGKLHSVVSAVLEAFRSDEDGGNVFWLAPDECLAEEAANELESVWYQLGLRDLTTYTLFGGTSFPLLDGLSNAIVIADIASFAGAIEKWREAETDVEQVFRDFGKKTRYVISVTPPRFNSHLSEISSS